MGGRREWRKNLDSDRRERRYRLRDESEWIKVDMPDLRVVGEDLAVAVEAEMARRSRPSDRSTGGSKRSRHLFSGLLPCGKCGANRTIDGKDHYRCARNRKRGTCDNSTAVRVSAVEDAALSALQGELLTPDLVRLFTAEFNREVEQFTRTRDEANAEISRWVVEIDAEIENLAKHFLAGAVSPTLSRMLSERKSERERLTCSRTSLARNVIPHPTLVRTYEAKVGNLREAQSDAALRTEAAQALRNLISGLIINLDDQRNPVIEIEASTIGLIDFAQTQNAPGPKTRGRSVALVAGTGFDRCRTQKALPIQPRPSMTAGKSRRTTV